MPPPCLDTTPVGDIIDHFNAKSMDAARRNDFADALNAARCAEALSLAVITYHADIAEAAIRESLSGTPTTPPPGAPP
jgi:hypothetical protein